METTHKIYFQSSQQLSPLADNSVDLIVTSPPYPMIEMWDQCLTMINPQIGKALKKEPLKAFELMHVELDKVWAECYRVLKGGGFLCVNIGDATRTFDKVFRLFPNHYRVIESCLDLGFTNLPNIIWRKQTNAPNKFMGSGMLPNGAYVTLEHEWILIFRKGDPRPYIQEQSKVKRRESAFFWEERNQWFSDIWELKGTKQALNIPGVRERKASFPFTLPYRLISMYSQISDVVLDPFYGLGTTSLAAMALGRNSIGFEIDTSLKEAILANLNSLTVDVVNKIVTDRLSSHHQFIDERKRRGKEVKYFNANLDCAVVTKQEKDLTFYYLETKHTDDKTFQSQCEYIQALSSVEPPMELGGLFGMEREWL